MTKKDKKQPHSFSFSKRMIDNLKYYNNTHPGAKLSQQVEKYLETVIPDMRG